MKNYVVIVRDHSASMGHLARTAAKDYNMNVLALQEAARRENQDTIVSTIKCGDGRARGTNLVSREVVNSNVQVLRELAEREYDTNGGSTPLFDSVGEAIDILKSVPDANDPDVAFLIMVITDGQENSSRKWSGHTLGREIVRLQGTDHWTFTFRVPRGYANALERMGIPGGNVLEWEQTERGMEFATMQTRSAIDNYYGARTLGKTAVQTFFTDLRDVKVADLKNLDDISREVEIFRNDKDTTMIREFVEKKTKKPFLKGAAFYELTKAEKKVQDYKKIVIRDRESGKVYGGDQARDLLGLPRVGDVKVVPEDHGKYDVFVQSTSVNRHIPAGSKVLYWAKVGVPYVEGVSAPWGR